MVIGVFALTLGAPAFAASPTGGTVVPVRPFVTPYLGPVAISPGAAASRCELAQCIKAVQLAVGGRQANFAIFATQPTIATVELSKSAPQRSADGVYSYNSNDLVASAFSAKETTHTVQFTALEPGATYHYLVNALKNTPSSDDAQKTGTFTMPKRYVTATINSVTVMDDSDALSAGDLVFNLRVNDSGPAIYPDANLIAFNPANGSTVQWSSGETRNVGLEVNVASGDSATVTLEGWDWDSEQAGWLNGQPITIDGDTVGISSDKAAASIAFDLSADDLGLPTTRIFSLQTTNQKLKFKATGTLSVTYAP